MKRGTSIRFKRLVAKASALFLLLALIVPALQTAPFIQTAQAISNVVGADADTSGPGLDGRDFRVTWTPEQSSPAGYTGTKIYIVPNSVSITAANVATNGCSGSACLERGFFPNFQQSSHVLPQFEQKDSANTNWNAATSYKACVFIDATTDTLDCSSAFSVTSDTVTDITPPNIDHRPLIKTITGQNVVIHAIIDDDQISDVNFFTQSSNAYIAYDANFATTNTPSIATNSGKVYVFGTSSAPSGSTFSYVMAVQDNAPSPNVTVLAGVPNLTSPQQAAANPIVAQVVSAGTRSISGTVRNTSNTAINNAYVFVAGLGVAGVNTDASGNYTISNVPDGVYDIVASADTYCHSRLPDQMVNTNVANANFSLRSGNCSGGPGTAPTMMFSFPPKFNPPPLNPSDKIRLGFNIPLDPTTVNDTDITAGPNILLLSNGTGAPVGAAATYCPDNSSPGCTSLISGDQNVILIEPATALTAGTYTLVIGANVTSLTGQSIQGSRSGGGEELFFSVGQGTFQANDIQNNFGQSGQYMPPFVKDFSAEGAPVPPNGRIIVGFNDAMDTATLTSSNIQLVSLSNNQPVSATVTVDNTTRDRVTITPTGNLPVGDYEVRVKGAIANSNGVTMRTGANTTSDAFIRPFQVAGSADQTAPTIFPTIANNATGIALGQSCIEFGFSEPMNPTTLNSTNVVLTRGPSTVTANYDYDPSDNSLCVSPNSVLTPGSAYVITFNQSGAADLNGNALGSAQTFTFTTTSTLDTTGPKIIPGECRFDDFSGVIRFNEPMNNTNSAGGSAYVGSTINHANFVLGITGGAADAIGASQQITYNPADSSVRVEGLTGLTAGTAFTLTIGNLTKDLSGNAIDTTNSANVCQGKIEDSRQTFGSLDGGGMFGPPVVFNYSTGGFGAQAGTPGFGGQTNGGAGGVFKGGDFGSFSTDNFIEGRVPMAFPFNHGAGSDVGVFHIELPWNTLSASSGPQNGDQLVFTFPKGTDVTNTIQDPNSPFKDDFNEFRTGTVTFDTSFGGGDGIAVDPSALTVTVQLAVTGTPAANDRYIIDTSGETNPIKPGKNYELDIKLLRSGVKQGSIQSQPYFIEAAGTNTITVNVCAGSCSTPTSVSGSIYVRGFGPGGQLDKTLTLTNGLISAVNGTAASNLQYTNLNNGCYNLMTDPFVTLGSTDFFGQDFPEPICVNGGQTTTKNIVLSAAAGSGASVPVNIVVSKSDGFSNVSAEIFAGGPGRFINKRITLNGTSTTATINLPQNGNWHIGIGPEMPKGPSAGKPNFDAFGAMPPPPVQLEVSGLPGTASVKQGPDLPKGVAFNDTTDTITYTMRTNNINVPVRVTDGTTAKANAEVFMHQRGFGEGAFGTTDASGDVTLKVGDFGTYEIGSFIPGAGEVRKTVDIRNVSNQTRIFINGTQVSRVDLAIKVDSFTISGKVLDASSNALANSPVWANDTNGLFRSSQASSDGSFVLTVPAGTWTLNSMPPPSKSETCGTFTKQVTITTESKSGQNIIPTSSTCLTLTGTVTVAGTAQANKMIFIEAWDTTNDRPSGGFHRDVSTNSSGVYTAEVPSGTYLVGMFDPTAGELANTVTVSSDNTSNNLSSGTTGTITFAFTGGTASMNGFIEVKGAEAGNSRVRFGKPINGASNNVTFNVTTGSYNYFIDLFGIGKFNGTAATGATTTISLASTNLVTLSGTVADGSGTPIPNATVTLIDTDENVKRFAQTDSSGNYSVSVKAGTYDKLTVDRDGYTAGSVSNLALTTTTTGYDFGAGVSPEQTGLVVADKTITGTVYQSNGSTPVTDGQVWATNGTTGQVVTAPVSPVDGTYTLNVPSAAGWTVSASAPKHGQTDAAAAITTADAGTDTANITCTADATRTPASVTSAVDASVGGTVDDSNNTGVVLKAAPGVLADSGQASIEIEKSFTAPPTSNFTPINNTAYDVSVTDANSQEVTTTNGTFELVMSYDPATLVTAGVSEANLSGGFYDNGTFRECEGGVTVDQTANTVKCVTSHFTTFAVVYPPASATTSSSRRHSSVADQQVTTTATSGGGGGGGGGGAVSSSTSASNSTTSSISSSITQVIETTTSIDRPLKLEGTLISVNKEGNKTAQITSEAGSLTIKPNKDSTVSVEIPADTVVTGGPDWNGNITPPLTKPSTIISQAGEPVEGSSNRIKQEEVAAIVRVGSTTSTLKFSNPVTFKVPVEATVDGTIVQVYTSEDGDKWKLDSDKKYTVVNGMIAFETTHFSYFAVIKTGEVDDTVVTKDGQLQEDTVTNEAKEAAPGVTGMTEASFSDTRNHWSKLFVDKLFGLGVVSGKSAGRFAPDEAITRAEITKIALNAFGYDTPDQAGAKPFPDVDPFAWYASYVQVAKQNNIISGYPDGNFRPNQSVTRAEALKILFRAAGVDVDARGVYRFKDTDEVSWYMKYVAHAKNNGIVDGYPDGTFRPGANITRAEVSKMAVRIMEMQ